MNAYTCWGMHKLCRAQSIRPRMCASACVPGRESKVWRDGRGGSAGSNGGQRFGEMREKSRHTHTHTPVRMHTHKSSKVCLECRNQEPEFSPTQFTTPGVSWDNRVTIKHSVVLFSSSFDPRVLGKSSVEVAWNVRWGVVARGGSISYSGSTLAGKIWPKTEH